MKRLFSRANREYSPENPERGVKISICNDQFVPRMGREMGEHKSRWWDTRFVPFHTIPLYTRGKSLHGLYTLWGNFIGLRKNTDIDAHDTLV